MSDRDTLYDLLDGLLPEREVVRSDIADAMVEAIEAAGWTPPAVHARLVEDVASTVRRFSATLDERDALRARVAELEDADREHSQLIEYLHHTHGIDIDREHDDFQEWQQQYGEVTELPRN